MKQAIVVKDDIGMSRGKMVAQACHASLGSYKKASQEQRQVWDERGCRKIVLVLGERKPEGLYQEAEKMGLPAFLVKDAGETELEPGTKTAIGIGPADEDKIDSVTGDLKLLD